MGQDSDGWKVIRYTPWKINRGPKNHPSVYMYIQRKGKTIFQTSIFGRHVKFPGCRTPEAESYLLYIYIYICWDPHQKNNFYLKNPRILLFEKIGGMATWMWIGDGWEVIRYTPWKINRGPKNHQSVYMYIQRKGKTIFQTSIFGYHVKFPGCRNSRS